MSKQAFSISPHSNTMRSGTSESDHLQNPNPNPNPTKKKRNLPGTPDPDAEVIAMSPKSLMAKNRFICEICNKGFQRDQNLQLHRRGHNLPWKLRQRTNKEQVKKKVYVCPEKSCVHHDPCRALGDLTGIKKHYSRKHGEKKWKCEKCSKKYAVQSDWKAHSKICGTREYKCECGTLFSRKDSFITHRAFCDALGEERISTSRISGTPNLSNFGNNSLRNGQAIMRIPPQIYPPGFQFQDYSTGFPDLVQTMDVFGSQAQAQTQTEWVNNYYPEMSTFTSAVHGVNLKQEEEENNLYLNNSTHQNMSATALLQKAAQIGSTRITNDTSCFNDHNNNAFGLLSSNIRNMINSNTSIVEVDRFYKVLQQGESDEKMNEMVNLEGSSSSRNNVLGGGGYLINDSFGIVTDTKNLDENDHMVDEERGNINGSSFSSNKNEKGLTRDFLGVGDDDHSHSIRRSGFLQQEQERLGELNAMGSSEYDGHHYC